MTDTNTLIKKLKELGEEEIRILEAFMDDQADYSEVEKAQEIIPLLINQIRFYVNYENFDQLVEMEKRFYELRDKCREVYEK